MPYSPTSRLTGVPRRILAVHEAGHALYALHQPLLPDLTYATIKPSKKWCGYTTLQRRFAHAHDVVDDVVEIEFSLAGMAAERVMRGRHTHLCHVDLKEATTTAENMILTHAEIEEFGPVAWEETSLHPSEAMRMRLEAWMRKIMSRCLRRVEKRFRAMEEDLNLIATALEVEETLNFKRLSDLLGVQLKHPHEVKRVETE